MKLSPYRSAAWRKIMEKHATIIQGKPYKVELHDDKLGVRISKRLSDDWEQIVFTCRPWVIWTRKHHWGKARPGRKEKKQSDARVLAQTVYATGPWELVSETADERLIKDYERANAQKARDAHEIIYGPSSQQWCTLHNMHQDDPEHPYVYPTCEHYLRDALPCEERRNASKTLEEAERTLCGCGHGDYRTCPCERSETVQDKLDRLRFEDETA